MNVPQETLDELAATALQVNSHFLQLADYLRQTKAPGEIQTTLETARQLTVKIQHTLIRAGAEDPLPAALPAAPKEIPLALLSSPAAKRYARAIREAALACREMETERYGADCDGFAEMLEDWAAEAELEVFGPTELRGME